MKSLLLLFVLLSVSSCEKKVTDMGGGKVGMGAVVREIVIGSQNQADVIKKLENWLIADGYEKPYEPWVTFAAKGDTVNAVGKRDSLYAYIKNLSEDRGPIAFRVALALENEPYITVF